jgi:hypothetical protein
MEPVLKFLFFFFFLFMIAFVGYKTYQFFNTRIRNSVTGWQLLAYAFLLIVANLILFFGGLLLFLRAYSMLKS